ncbi:hypothetical protein MUA26_04825 [Staphylococcus sp. IVB6246]|uniref:hypothetical protein n=1 Tax=Staphylococcus sp. IVB6246 TaxID=2989772 RepID=UPI0021CF5115|nr:hypothetical protein [Staphylococcus sp. IVB6246]UXR70454.1 hypothetical protein MUA26_04825 [Staphylococcus sp. IVB6246]
MEGTTWQIIQGDRDAITLNMSYYTSIFNEYETIEETWLMQIFQYFQKRKPQGFETKIIDLNEDEQITSQTFTAFLISNEMIENEHGLASSSLLYKSLSRNLKNDFEVEGYYQSINALLEDLLMKVNHHLPLEIKPYNDKLFMKQLMFSYREDHQYSRRLNRILRIFPILINEMNEVSSNKTLIIYMYPESNLSPKEQVQLNTYLKSLEVPIIVLTGVSFFLSDTLEGMNYLINDQQMLTESLIETLEWDAPINFSKEDIQKSLKQFLIQYHEKFELNPTISNYAMKDIMLFNPCDLYTGLSFLHHCKQPFKLDLDYEQVPISLASYIRDIYKMKDF